MGLWFFAVGALSDGECADLFCDGSADVVDGGGNFGLEVGQQWDVAERGETLLSGGDRRLYKRFHGLTDLGVGVLGAHTHHRGRGRVQRARGARWRT